MADMKKELIEAARKARENAYAPYSKFKVGCAVLTESGKVFDGCNVENASYRLANCAETTALTKAISEGHKKFKMIAVMTGNGGTPCGACRQTIWELCGKIDVIVSDPSGNSTTYSSEELLPYAFELKDI